MNINTFLSAIDTTGNVQLINAGTSDNTVPIYYELETQEIELGDRSHLKKIQDKIKVLSKNAFNSTIQIREDDKDYKELSITLDKTVAESKSSNFSGNFFSLKWFGNSSNNSPVFDGFKVEKINDCGIIK